MQGSGGLIVEAARVRALRPEEARHPRPVSIRGVVTTANAASCVVQDASGPVYAVPSGGTWAKQPLVGERWEFAGVTDPGEFSPIVMATRSTWIGQEDLPRPIRPAWEQLLNGSLDVELIELRGILLAASDREMTLLLAGGVAKIVTHRGYPLPERGPKGDGPPAAPGALVRVRGVFFAYRDPATRQLVPARFLLGDARLEVEETAPVDPWMLPTRRAEELLRFDAGADALRRFKVAGQVLYARPDEYFLHDGDNSLRVRAKGPPMPAPGELVEAVGFPRLGGPSPSLLEAITRRTGREALPAPRDLSEAELADEKHDATRVRLEARLAGVQTRRGERVLELQAGRFPFLARLPGEAPLTDPLRAGASLRLTGVYASLRGDAARASFDGFELLLGSPADIEVLRNGPWWTARHTAAALAALAAGLAATLAWITALRRTVAHRTALLETEVHERERAEQRRVLEQERARVAQDLHDELGAGLTQIGLLGSLAARPEIPPERAREQVAVIAGKAREMVAALDEIVWALNPKHDTAGSVRGYLCDYAEEFLRAAGIGCRFEADPGGPELLLQTQQRHELFLAFKETLTNIVKHAAATEVGVQVAAAGAELVVRVADNGRGLRAGPAGATADGISNLRSRLARVGGRCEIESLAAGGTVVSLCLPARGGPTP